jgi:hypothetical protein
MIKAKATNPVGFNNWPRHLNLDEKPDMSQIYSFIFFIFCKKTSVDTEMCCPKGCGCQYYILLTLKKIKSWTQGPGSFLIKN